jgi:hypothetical protein
LLSITDSKGCTLTRELRITQIISRDLKWKTKPLAPACGNGKSISLLDPMNKDMIYGGEQTGIRCLDGKYLDSIGSLYFTKEGYDDFYYGKGSTYPDVNGAIGILFEQASSRGHLQDSINGPLSFSATIQNQLTTSLSTIRGAVDNRSALLSYQQEFYKSAQQQAKNSKVKGYMLTESADQTRLAALLDVLQRHHVEVYQLNRDWQDESEKYPALSSYYVPLQQPQYRLIKAMFSTEKNFPDNTFYDVFLGS